MQYKDIKQIPLNKLRVSPFNVRKLGMFTQEEYEKQLGQDESCSQDYRKLKPSILETSGIIEALVVVEHDGNYDIVQGQRRYLAFKELYEEGKLTCDLVWCIIKVPNNPKTEEQEIAIEELVTEKTKMSLGNNFRYAYQIVLNHVKDVDTVGRILGMQKEDAIMTYTYNQVLNAPASVEDRKDNEPNGVQVSINNVPNNTTKTKSLSHDEMQYALRWQRENPSISEVDIETKVQHWFKETQPMTGRVKTVLIHALADYAKSEKISTQTALERFLYSELRRFLIDKRFYSEQVEE